jgi:hypothetical protein
VVFSGKSRCRAAAISGRLLYLRRMCP